MREDIARWSRGRNDEFMKERSVRGQRVTRYSAHSFGKVVRVLIAPACHLAKAFWTECRHVDSDRGCHQPLVRTDIGGRFLSPDVLFARLQGQHESSLAFGIRCHPGQSPGHLPHVGLARGKEPDIGAAVSWRHAKRLSFRGDHIGSEITWWLKESERNGIRAHHQGATTRVRE